MSMTTSPAPIAGVLPDRGVVRVTGEDAAVFLDRLVTSDLDGLQAGAARHAALLSPQGKVLFEFLVVASGNGEFLLDCLASAAPDLVKRLSLYRLRAKVEIADVSANHAVVMTGTLAGEPAAVAGAVTYADPRSAALPARAIVARNAIPAPLAAASDYDARRIAARVPEAGRDYALGDVVPHEALLDRTGGVSFSKGCYVGQEIVSRMEHRGTARKRFVRVELAAHAALPAMGTEIRAGEASAGVMGSSVVAADGRGLGLALLRLDRLAEFSEKGLPLVAGDVTVTPDAGDVADLMAKTPDPVAPD